MSIAAYFQTRDKKVAHNEAIEASNRKHPTWSGGTSLLDYAKQFVGAIGFGYLNVSFGQVGTQYYLTSDASHAAQEIYKLLKAAGIITGNV